MTQLKKNCEDKSILIPVNNHLSFKILELCNRLSKENNTISTIAVCSPKFYKSNVQKFSDLGIEPKLLSISSVNDFQNRSLGALSSLKSSSEMKQEGNSRIKAWLRSVVSTVIFSSSLFFYLRELLIRFRLKAHIRIARDLFEGLNPTVVFSLSDRSHDYVESSLLYVARKKGIKIILPYIANFSIQSAIEYRSDNANKILAEFSTFSPFSLYKLKSYFVLKEQVISKCFFQAPFNLNAHKTVGTLSKYPWWVGNGISDIVCVDSVLTAKKYKVNKVDPSKLTITGHIDYDLVFSSMLNKESIKSKLMKSYDLVLSENILVLSMPQYAEQGFIAYEDHWVEIETLLSQCQLAEYNLLVSLHPRQDRAKYEYLEKKYSCRILSEPLAEIIAVADIFVAANSNTLIWSVLCGIPAISVMSPTEYLYSHLSSVLHVERNKDVYRAIGEMNSFSQVNRQYDWLELSREKVFDGKVAHRFLKLVES